MSAIYDAMPQKLRKVMMIVITAVTALAMLGLAWYSLQYILNLHSKGRVYPALGFPVWMSYVWVPIGFLVTGIQYALTLVKNLQHSDVYLSTNLHEADAQEVEV